MSELIERVKKGEIGGWSLYYLVEIALQHHYPDKDIENMDVYDASKLVNELGYSDWRKFVIDHENKVGYKNLDSMFVNEN